MWRKWESLPKYMQTEAVRPYYEYLKKKRFSLVLKRGFDFTAAIFMFVVLLPVFLGISIAVAMDSRGGVLFLQERITQYGRKFRIFKFRTMVANGKNSGIPVTICGDKRVTKVGKILRKYRLDELPQLINIILGDMSFVGTRPEVPVFVRSYSPEMMATLLLPAGVTSEASIQYKEESQLLEMENHANEVYIHQVLPEKMKYNLKAIREYSFIKELQTMIRTIFAVLQEGV